jgi:hypothetical protein
MMRPLKAFATSGASLWKSSIGFSGMGFPKDISLLLL